MSVRFVLVSRYGGWREAGWHRPLRVARREFTSFSQFVSVGFDVAVYRARCFDLTHEKRVIEEAAKTISLLVRWLELDRRGYRNAIRFSHPEPDISVI